MRCVLYQKGLFPINGRLYTDLYLYIEELEFVRHYWGSDTLCLVEIITRGEWIL